MIPNQWYAILESNEIRHDRPVGVTRLGEKLVFWRDTYGQVICQQDKCAHRGAALSKGQILGDRIQCPFHGFQYDATGRCRLIPAKGKAAPVPERVRVQTYPTREAHDFIWIWWGKPRDDPPPLPFFDDLDDSFTYAAFRDYWPVHYSRAIENQLDVMHLPFVHHNTIGRGGRTVVDGPLVRWVDDNKMNVYVYNRQDDGTPPLKPDQVPEPRGPLRLQFHFPNIWENHISEHVRIAVAFAPVDEENTVLYLRFYQNFVRVPFLGHLVNSLAMPFNIIVLRQDKRVVTTQQPKKTALKMGEKLVQGDQPIVAYRTRRQELIDKATQTRSETFA